VALRYRWRSPDGSYDVSELAPLLVDVPARSSARAFAPILGPRHSGPMQLRLDLVQRIGDEQRALPIAALERSVEVTAAERHTSER
jgi:ubiquinone biosynthesis protein UbiJ